MPGRNSIAEWLGDRTDVSVAEVLQHVFGIAKEQSQCRSDPGRKDFGAPDLGFTKHRPRAQGAQESVLA